MATEREIQRQLILDVIEMAKKGKFADLTEHADQYAINGFESAIRAECAEREQAAREELDAAIAFIRSMQEEFVNAGFPCGDRTVLMANVRRALAANAFAAQRVAVALELAAKWRKQESMLKPPHDHESRLTGTECADELERALAAKEVPDDRSGS